MNQTHLSRLIMGVALIAVILVALQAFGPSLGAEKGSRVYTGMGDLRRFEVQQSIPDSEGQASGKTYAGMGDLHFFEAQQMFPANQSESINRSYVGMGDLHFFEAQQENLNK